MDWDPPAAIAPGEAPAPHLGERRGAGDDVRGDLLSKLRILDGEAHHRAWLPADDGEIRRLELGDVGRGGCRTGQHPVRRHAGQQRTDLELHPERRHAASIGAPGRTRRT